jgi:flavorubredoxin
MAADIDTAPVSINSGSREVLDGIYLIQECNPKPALQAEYADGETPEWYVEGREVHMQQNAYLVVGDDETLLWDTTSPANAAGVVSEVDSLLDGRDLDYLMPSHPEAPHAGNSFKILDAHPEADFVVPEYETAHELYMMGDATRVSPGDRVDLGGRAIEIVDPVFVDHKVHMWAQELTTNTLFTVDLLGMVHMDTECLHCADELDAPITPHRLAEFHSRALFWFEYVDASVTDAAIEGIIKDLAPTNLAPAHGSPIRGDADTYLRRMKEVIRRISDAGKTTEAW